MKNIFKTLCERNLVTKTEGNNKRNKIFNLAVNTLTMIGTYKLTILTGGLYGLTLALLFKRKNKKDKWITLKK